MIMMIHTYEEAVQLVGKMGVLPLSSLIPNYPSLESVTTKESWHSGAESDPWTWRTRFPADGVAGYGKFIKKKSILISHELFPYAKAILGSTSSLQERYKAGLVSKEALHLFALIQADEGIDTRALRAEAGMKAVEQKKPFDQALVELQGSMDIVISGIKERTNSLGEQNGWNSTSFETTDHWMTSNGLDLTPIRIQDAKQKLHDQLAEHASSEAMAFFRKIFQLQGN